MTVRTDDDIARQQEGRQKVSRPAVRPDEIKARIGTVGCVSYRMGTVVLKKDVVVLGILIVAKVLERILVPDDIDVLKQQIKTQPTDELNANHLGHHHGNETPIAIPLGRRRRDLSEFCCVYKNYDME